MKNPQVKHSSGPRRTAPRSRGLRPLLPGETVADPTLVDDAVADLNQIYASKALETAQLVGEYVLDHFFEGSVRKFRERGRKHVSLRMLARREELRMSTTFLWTAVAIVGQLRIIPENIAQALPLSHHRLLLPVKDLSTKVALATRAVEEDLSKRELEQELRCLQQTDSGKRHRGRPTKPLVVKALSRLSRLSEDVLQSTDSASLSWGNYSEKDARLLLHDVEIRLEALEHLVALLRARL